MGLPGAGEDEFVEKVTGWEMASGEGSHLREGEQLSGEQRRQLRV